MKKKGRRFDKKLEIDYGEQRIVIHDSYEFVSHEQQEKEQREIQA